MNRRQIKTTRMALLVAILFVTLPQPSLAGGKPHYFGGVPDMSAKPNSGVLLEEVRPKSPAEQAGLQARDIIKQIGEVTIRNPDDFFSALKLALPDKPVTVIYIRGGQEHQTEVVLEPRRAAR
jgi:S1-C subfamily serine protease